MLDSLNYEDYTKQVGTRFEVPDAGVEIELVEVTGRVRTPRQDMFSLVFRGARDRPLEQKIHRLRHAALGDGELFLVPVGVDTDGYRYEAGFNRLVDHG